MALEVSMTGTGTLGDITPNWTANEFATPVTIGENTSGSSTVSFTARATDESLLCINNNITSTTGISSYGGVVQSVSQNGLSASVTHGTVFDKLNLELDVPPILGGDTSCILDYFVQEVLKHSRTTKEIQNNSTNQFFTMNGHTRCYLADANDEAVYVEPTVIQKNFSFEGTGSELVSYNYTDIRNTLSATNFVRKIGKIFANNVTGNMFFDESVPPAGSDGSRIYYKTYLNLGNNTFHIVGNITFVNSDWEIDATATIKYATGTLELEGTYALGGVSETFLVSVDISTLDLDDELAVFIQYFVDGTGNYKLRASVCNVNNLATYFVAEQTLSNQSTPIINGWTIDGLARDIYIEINTTPDPTLTTEKYWTDITSPNFSSSLYFDESGHDVEPPIIAYSGIFWEYLQMACAAYSQQVVIYDSNFLTLKDVSNGGDFDMTNVVASPTINPTSTLSGKQINVAYSESSFVDGTVYDAEQDGNNIISVKAGETTVTSVKHTVNPIYLNQPVRSDTWPITAGQYYVIDSSGVRLLAGEWEEYGASVTVEIDPDDPAAIRITVVGPYTDTTLAGGPYELAASDGENKYASLKISGTGVYSGSNVLGLLTGVDPEKYTRATVKTINNPFISTVEQAYDRGIWAAQKASGPVVTMSATVPFSSLYQGFTPDCGKFIDYMNSTYRITSCSYNNTSGSLTTERYVTVADIDAIWGSQTVADYDSLWGNYECQDQIIFPYKVA